MCAALLGWPAAGQSIDPRVLQQLQGQLGAGSATSGSQLDAARAGGTTGTADSTPTVGRIDTDEEQALRREQSRQQLDRLYAPSPVEREYRDRLADPTLRQFGYDLLRSAQRGTPGALTGSVSDSYTIGIGDDLVVQFQGGTNDSRTVRVDREGRLVVGALPPIQAARPVRLGAVRRELEAATKRTLLGTEVFVSLGSVRAITVFVGGEVDRPGQYNLTSMADVGAALALAGGVRRSGSLRNVRIVRAGGGVAVDLYGLIGIGAPPAVRLQDGDRIIVPVIGDTVAIAGAVARPGIYEIRRGTSVGAVLDYAGGALRPRGNTLVISRIAPGGAETFVRAVSLASRVEPGDAIQLVGGSAGGATGRVTLRGYVENPGPRPLIATPTVADLLGPVADLRFDTYLPMAVLIRRDPETAARVFEPVNLITALRSRPGVALRSDDRLYVFSRADIGFLNSIPVRRIVLGQPNPYPECRSLARLEALAGDTRSARFDVVTRGAYVVERNGQERRRRRRQSPQRDTRRRDGADRRRRARRPGRSPGGRRSGNAAGAAQPGGGDGIGPHDADFCRRRHAGAQRRRHRPLPARLRGGARTASRPDRECGRRRRGGALARSLSRRRDAVGARPRRGRAGHDPQRLSDLTLDLSHGGDLQRIAATSDAVLAATRVAAGDDLRFNALQPQFENGGVLLTGEVARPGLYAVRRGERLSELLARAGGVTPLAYPYGSIFTRRSVKEARQEGIRRTTRELTNAFLTVSARRAATSGGGDSTSSAAALIALARLDRGGGPGRDGSRPPRPRAAP